MSNFRGVDKAATLEAIDRVGEIIWRDDADRQASHVALMREYLRRAAVCAEALGRAGGWPWYDAAARLVLSGVDRRFLPGYVFLDSEPEYPGPGADPQEDKIIALHRRVQQAGRVSMQMRSTYLWFVRWASVRSHPALAPVGLPDLYEPLIVMYERGGWFRTEHGYIDFNGRMIGAGSLQTAAQRTPLPSLASEALDRLDRTYPWEQ